MNIAEEAADRIAAKYGTHNPFLLSEHEGISVLYREYVDTLGYYLPVGKSRFIVIDIDVHRIGQTVICSHELGHAILHPDVFSCFNMEEEVSEYEWAATDFARRLLFPDDPLMTTGHMLEYMQFVIRRRWRY